MIWEATLTQLGWQLHSNGLNSWACLRQTRERLKCTGYQSPSPFLQPTGFIRIHQDSSGFNRTHQDSTGEAGLHLHLSRTFQAGTRGSANGHLAWGWLLVSRSQQHFFTSSFLRRFEIPQAFTSHPFVMQGSTGQNKCWHRRLLFTQL